MKRKTNGNLIKNSIRFQAKKIPKEKTKKKPETKHKKKTKQKNLKTRSPNAMLIKYNLQYAVGHIFERQKSEVGGDYGGVASLQGHENVSPNNKRACFEAIIVYY